MSMSIAGIRAHALSTADVLSTADGKDPKAAAAAGQFEALLIAQMLKSMRESESGWLGTGEDSASDSAMGMAEEHFASAISAAGGLGLARIVNAGLKAPDLSGSVNIPGSQMGGQVGS
jgi:Rod binding domain-containing protein